MILNTLPVGFDAQWGCACPPVSDTARRPLWAASSPSVPPLPQHPLQALGGQAVQLLGENVDELMLTAAPGVQSRPTR